MDVSTFSDERIINTIEQSYHFSPEVVQSTCEEALQRKLFSSIELKSILEKNKQIQEEKSEENYQNMKAVTMRDMGKTNHWNNVLLLFSIACLLFCVVMYFWKGYIVWYAAIPSVGSGGALAYRRSNRFRN